MKDQHLNVKCKQSAIQCFDATSGPQIKAHYSSSRLHNRADICSRYHYHMTLYTDYRSTKQYNIIFINLWFLGGKLALCHSVVFNAIHILIYIKLRYNINKNLNPYDVFSAHNNMLVFELTTLVHSSQSLPTEPSSHSVLLY